MPKPPTRRKNALIATAVCAAISAAVLAVIPLNFRVNKTFSALYSANALYEQPRSIEVKIEGVYSFRLFRADGFKGDIIIEGFKETARNDVDFGVGGALSKPVGLYYRRFEGSELTTYPFGYIDAGFLMRRVDITPNHMTSDDGGCIDLSDDGGNAFICYPAKNAERFGARYEKFLKKLR